MLIITYSETEAQDKNTAGMQGSAKSEFLLKDETSLSSLVGVIADQSRYLCPGYLRPYRDPDRRAMA